jgi:NitT/TauT family transport system substrate-binding protein
MALFTVFALTSCDSQQDSASANRAVLRIATQPDDFQRVLLEKSGQLEDLPFDIEWSKFNSGNETVEALNAGAVDLVLFSYGASQIIAQSNAPTTWTAESAPFKIVGLSKQNDELAAQAIVVPEGSPVQSIADLRGKRVGFANAGAGHYYFLKAAAAAGLGPDDFDIARMTRTESATAFSSGALDALVTTYGNQAMMFVETQGARVISTAFDMIKSFVLDVASVGALDDPAISEAIGEILVRRVHSDKWEADNVAEVGQLQQSEQKDSLSEAQRAAQILVTTTYVPITAETIAAQQDIIDVFVDLGIAQNDVDVSVGFDERYNEQIEAALTDSGQA